MGVESPEDVESLTADQLDQLIFAAHMVVDRNYLHREAAELPLATAIMDRASAMQREGHSFAGVHHTYYVGEHEKRPVRYATTEPRFWAELAQYAEWHEVTPTSVATLYGDWKDRYVAWQSFERAKHAIDESGSSAEDFLPEGCVNIEVVPHGGTVVYDDIENLLFDMRRYYVPRSERFDSFTAAAPEIITSSGMDTVAGLSLLAQLNALAGTSDEANMNRIEEEMRAELRRSNEYRDSYDDGMGDPYKYMTTMFSGQGIAVRRNPEGAYELSIEGRGYNRGNPTEFIERFAILNGRDVTYGDGMSINYYANTPEELVRVTRGEGDKTRDFVKVAVPLGAILQTLGNTLGLSIENVDEMARAIIEAQDYRGASFRLGDFTASVRVEVSDMAYDAENSQVTGYKAIIKSSGVEEFAIPETRTEVSVAIDLPGVLQQVVKRAVSARTLIHSRPIHSRSRYRTITQEVDA